MGFRKKIPMQTVNIIKIIKESRNVKTFELECSLLDAKPGQFLMVWEPAIGEMPISIANNNPLTITVASVGKVSNALHKKKEWDLISFRGPLGNGFFEPAGDKVVGRILVVGGGYGTAPLYFLSKRAVGARMAVDAVIGANTSSEVIYEKRLYSKCSEVFVTTDDGTKGKKGNVMEEVKWLTEERGFDMVYACGPEKMMEAIAILCREKMIPCQLSLERYMKCGVGVCGSCDLGGKSVCRDGPIFSGNEALNLNGFGKTKRDAAGRTVQI